MTQTASAAASATIPPLCLNAFNGSAFLGEKENLRGWIDGAAAAGMPLLGPDAFTLGQWTEQGHTLPALAQHMRDAGVGCGTIAASAMLDGGPHALPMLMQAADAADALGARFLQVNMDGTGHAARQAALEQAVTALDGRGLTLAIEYMPQTGLNSVSETVALARHVGTDKAERRAGKLAQIDILAQRHAAGMNREDLAPSAFIGHTDHDLTVETARTPQCLVDRQFLGGPRTDDVLCSAADLCSLGAVFRA